MNKGAAVKSFIEIADRVIKSGSTDKARKFSVELKEKVLAKGDLWIARNADALGVSIIGGSEEYANGGEIAPVEDNRIWFLTDWQLTLADH